MQPASRSETASRDDEARQKVMVYRRKNGVKPRDAYFRLRRQAAIQLAISTLDIFDECGKDHVLAAHRLGISEHAFIKRLYRARKWRKQNFGGANLSTDGVAPSQVPGLEGSGGAVRMGLSAE